MFLISTPSNNNYMKFLIDTEQPEYLYIIKAFATVTPFAIFLAIVIYYVYSDTEQTPLELSKLSEIFWVILFIPFVETIIMIPILAFFKVVCRNHIFWVALWSALIWAGLHFLVIPAQGVVSFFTFLILSISFLSWDKISRKKAIFVTFTIHALNNATGVILYNLPLD